MIIETKDPMGAAIAEYYAALSTGKQDNFPHRLRVFSPMFEEDEIPLPTLFRTFNDMPALERKALESANGKILDVGAGAGCHALALQLMGKDVTAIDISPLSVETMQKRGVTNALLQDFWTIDTKYDTILMLMNGIGIIGTMDNLPRFFAHIDNILAEGGTLLLDSSDICYVFEDEHGIIELPFDDDKYYGELTYQMQYRNIKGDSFPWLYIDPNTLTQQAARCGFKVKLIAEGNNFDYLAQITRA